MPLFEFVCERCGSEFEHLVFSSTHEKPVCPNCGSPQTRKLMSAFRCVSRGGGLAGGGHTHSPGGG